MQIEQIKEYNKRVSKVFQHFTNSNQFTLSEVTMTTHILTQEELKSQIHYNPETGIFIRKVIKARRKDIQGKTGHLNSDGYLEMSINCKKHKAHRLAWLYMTGEWPKNHIDHINGNRADNRFSNLREATWKQNNQNRKKCNGNLPMGVRVCKGKYQASIMIDKKSLHLGTFDSAKIAHEVYIKAKRELHEFCTI